MMSIQRPSLRRVLSDTWRIISSNSLHFASLSLLFIFPISLFSIIYTWLLQPSQFSYYGRPLSDSADSQIPSSFNKSLILSCLIILIFNLCAVSSITTTIFHALRGNPLKLTSSLKSILTSFLPLLATKLVYFVIMAAINLGIGICVAFVFGGLILVGAVTIDPSSKSFMAVALVMAIPYLAAFVYFGVKWCLAYAVVVVESNYGYAPLERSSTLLARGASRVAFLLVAMFAIPQMILAGWVWALARGSGGGCSGGVVAQMVVWAALSTGVGLFGLGATAVLLVHCKELNGEAEELELQSDEKKLYVKVPHLEV